MKYLVAGAALLGLVAGLAYLIVLVQVKWHAKSLRQENANLARDRADRARVAAVKAGEDDLRIAKLESHATADSVDPAEYLRRPPGSGGAG